MGFPCQGSESGLATHKIMKRKNHAWIEWKKQEGSILIKAYFETDENKETLFYQLHALKKGASGQTVTSQSGEFNAKAGEKVILSTLGLSLGTGDSCVLTLKVFDGHQKLLSAYKKIIKEPL